MKRQFIKVKQFADQTFSRSGKTEALSDTLQIAEKRVEFIKNACQNTTKKLLATLISPGLGHDSLAREKRLKKMPDYLLAMAMLDNGTIEEDNILRQVLVECSKVLICLANAGVDYELRIEQTVLNKLQQVLDVDVPNIIKQKRLLTKLVVDMDLARAKYQTAIKNSNSGSSHTNKVDASKEELEDIELKVEQCRDSLASEIFQLISREAEFSSILMELMKHQRSYHQTALAVLDQIVPELETVIDSNPAKPVFGQRLEDHLRVTKRRIAYPIELCICTLLEISVEEEGLFRIAAGASKVRCMKLRLDSNCLDLESAVEYRDPHIIAGVLKSYLRQLPEPLLTHHLYEEWIAAAKLQTSESRLQAILNVVQKLPQSNLYNLRYIIKFLAMLTKHQDLNKMSPQNLAIVIAPNLLWTPEDKNDNIGLNMNAAACHNVIVDCLISHSDWIFPGEEEFYVTLKALDMNDFNGHKRSSSGDTHLISTNDAVNTNLKRSRSSTNITDMSPPSESPKPHTRGRKSKPAPVPPSPTSKANNVFESPVVIKDLDKTNCDKPPPGSLLKPSQTTESPREKLPAVDTGSLKRPVKPAVAPRTILETSDDTAFRKPAIPERPASLQRPLSSSFRSLRILTDLSNEKPDVDQGGGPMLERAHLYTVSKQQVSLIQVGNQCDDKEITQNQHSDIIDSNTNQESSNNDNDVCKSPNFSSHRRTPSDTQIGQLPTLKTPTRTQRPIPPPPPPPVCSSKKEPESTDL
ncbi:rho GTPase-activating protein 44-like [Sipha flava]|uniref:Rho GTPase-activating protein 17 n=1 Tax=Sipha flava TaxID=143950 RepID=A0A2S2QDU2_9HEMI|nr:rho GTPase-activating protein 44-like [Sipha flava]XP_025415725.1 rho GTPase-activating protein 44-like [Sipha flava]